MAMATPNPQPYPASKIKVGAVLYSVLAWTEESGKTAIEIEEWVVRSIQAKRGTKSLMGYPAPSFKDKSVYVNIAQKVDRLTWGKRSSRTGDFGWRKSIPKDFRKQFAVGSNLPLGIFTTVRAALVYEIANTADSIDWYTDKIATETDAETLAELKAELGELQAQHPVLNRRLKYLDNQRSKDKLKTVVSA